MRNDKKLTRRALAGAMAATVIGMASPAWAIAWLGIGSSNWNSGGNWFGFSTPGAGDDASFFNNDPTVFRADDGRRPAGSPPSRDGDA